MSFQILIIDDDESFRHLLGLRLRKIFPGCSITEFENLKTARGFLKSNPPLFDLVLLDQHLPDGRGLELLNEGLLSDLAVLAVSSDDAPHIPGATIQAGAAFFLSKLHVSEPLFEPLVRGIVDRNRLSRELTKAKIASARMDSIKTLVHTLRHEINNPLGAVMGAAYIVKTDKTLTADQKEAAEIIESSSKRIQHVLKQLCEAALVEPTEKGGEQVFHVPGDTPWKK